MNHVSVSPTLVRVFLCPCVGPFPSVGLTLTWFIWDRYLALHILHSIQLTRLAEYVTWKFEKKLLKKHSKSPENDSELGSMAKEQPHLTTVHYGNDHSKHSCNVVILLTADNSFLFFQGERSRALGWKALLSESRNYLSKRRL